MEITILRADGTIYGYASNCAEAAAKARLIGGTYRVTFTSELKARDLGKEFIRR